MPTLEVEGIDVFYGSAQALWNVSFEAGEKEIVALLGANGAGKSTMLMAISGLVRPARGTITFGNDRLDLMPPHKIALGAVAHVPEGRRLFGDMTVEENLLLGSLAPTAKKERYRTLERVYGLFPRLKERRRQKAGALSGGERQMAAVGRGLMALPKILMLDEPSLGLAPVMALEIFRIIKQVNEEGISIVLVEQNVKQSLAICHRAYVLENGRVVMSGDTAELSENPEIKTAYLGI